MQKEAINGTLAYNKALLEGVDPQKAFAAGLDELIEKGNYKQKCLLMLKRKLLMLKKTMKLEEWVRDEIQKEMKFKR